MGNHKGKRQLVRPRRRWEDNTKLDLQVVWDGALTVLIWLKTETGGVLLEMW